MKEKIILFPGFSQSKELYGDYEYANIWEEKFHKYDLKNKDYIIGHSMGSLAGLIHWRENKDATVILFNPLLPKRSRLNILTRFFRMILNSSGTLKAIKGSTNLVHLPVAVQNAFELTKVDALSIIKEIPKDKLVIIKGEGDSYFFDSDSIKALQENGFGAIVFESVGHYWDKKVDELIYSIVLK